MPTITYLALDASNDPILDPAQSLTDRDAVAQAILTRLRLFLGEWWEDLTIGLPVMQKILGQLGSKSGQAAMASLIQREIEGTPYVTSVTDVQIAFIDGQFSYTATANTVFGTVTVSSVPGANMSLGV